MELDLHVHSRYSYDCLSSPRAILRRAAAQGLSAIAVTDHGTIKGACEARALNRYPGPLVIVGVEVPTDAGDILGLFLSSEIEAGAAEMVIGAIREQGGISVLAHPAKGHRRLEHIARLVDLIEVCNSRVDAKGNELAYELARELGKPAVAGSDAHFLDEIGRSRVILDVLSDEREIKEALISRPRRLECRSTSYRRQLLSKLIRSAKLRRPGDVVPLLWQLAKAFGREEPPVNLSLGFGHESGGLFGRLEPPLASYPTASSSHKPGAGGSDEDSSAKQI